MVGRRISVCIFAVVLILTGVARVKTYDAPIQQGNGFIPAPARRSDEGLGPFRSMMIRGVMIVDGTGAPPYGPMNVFVEGNRIARITSAGTASLPLRQGGPPPAGV